MAAIIKTGMNGNTVHIDGLIALLSKYPDAKWEGKNTINP
jgi:hypothetical protein